MKRSFRCASDTPHATRHTQQHKPVPHKSENVVSRLYVQSKMITEQGFLSFCSFSFFLFHFDDYITKEMILWCFAMDCLKKKERLRHNKANPKKRLSTKQKLFVFSLFKSDFPFTWLSLSRSSAIRIFRFRMLDCLTTAPQRKFPFQAVENSIFHHRNIACGAKRYHIFQPFSKCSVSERTRNFFLFMHLVSPGGRLLNRRTSFHPSPLTVWRCF